MSKTQVPHGGATLLIFQKKFLAAQLEAYQALYAQVEQKHNILVPDQTATIQAISIFILKQLRKS